MAKSVDNFSDLKELGIDCDGSSDDSLTDIFTRAANHLQRLLPSVDNQTLLVLYGYYKQGSEGACNTPKPSWYDMKAKAKWEAWSKLGNMPQAEAKRLYIKTIKKVDPSFDDSDGPKEQWIKVSSMKDEEIIPEKDKTLVDYIKGGNIKDVKDYLEKNSDGTVLVNKTDADGLAPIHWAADSGFQEIIGILIAFGADVNLQDNNGQTALHYAASCGHVGCVKFLLEHGSKEDIIDNDGCSPLYLATDDSIKKLLSSKS